MTHNFWAKKWKNSHCVEEGVYDTDTCIFSKTRANKDVSKVSPKVNQNDNTVLISQSNVSIIDQWPYPCYFTFKNVEIFSIRWHFCST